MSSTLEMILIYKLEKNKKTIYPSIQKKKTLEYADYLINIIDFYSLALNILQVTYINVGRRHALYVLSFLRSLA